MTIHDSFESEELKKMIERKKQFFKKQTNKTTAQYLQKEILFLQNEILPVVLNNTTIVHNEMAKYVIRCYETALKYNCNALLTYLPITDEYKERPIIGIANCRDLPFETPGAMQIYCDKIEILNMDGRGSIDNVDAFTLPIHQLL